ncbi:MAG: hypothetical protein HY216_11940 [Candidatus Rokubacteria bacterium]|nr:hypothetical protein [Candidatus Rokubacteria bacterium]
MDCDAVRQIYVESLASGEGIAEAATRHLATCPGCRNELQALDATWMALAVLPLVDPSATVRRRLLRRVRWQAAREALLSLQSWQQAALAGVVGFLLSVLLAVILPYEAMVEACRGVAPGLPVALAYAVGALVYGLVPMAVAVSFEARRRALPGVLGLIEAPAVFLAAIVPYVVLRCAEFPVALLIAFVAGLATGAVGGGGAGTWIGRRHAWT